ncbi:hypothetical protein GQX74_009758 [Glossina fuscipes]|nr:hypothetical protein GQX74_009758 [Glossina fuscipes]
MSSWNGMPVDHVYFEVVSQCSFGMFAFSYLHQVFSVILVKIFPQQTSLYHTRAINLYLASESTKSIKELPSEPKSNRVREEGRGNKSICILSNTSTISPSNCRLDRYKETLQEHYARITAIVPSNNLKRRLLERERFHTTTATGEK